MASEREREFGIEELFFSTTNEKGIIISCNQVFTRVAAYEEPEMIGKPHSLIRHPEMPRCVFKSLWDTIEQGQTIAAYVNAGCLDASLHLLRGALDGLDGDLHRLAGNAARLR